ncbi:MAG: hypothetical protein AABX59_02240 [Nanoarchaeota archaeon]
MSEERIELEVGREYVVDEVSKKRSHQFSKYRVTYLGKEILDSEEGENSLFFRAKAGEAEYYIVHSEGKVKKGNSEESLRVMKDDFELYLLKSGIRDNSSRLRRILKSLGEKIDDE